MGDIAHQFGLAEEVTWGTIVAPNRFFEFTNETLHRENTIANSNGIRSGRRYGGQSRRIARQTANGSVTFEVARTGFGVFFEYLLGAVNSVNTVGTVWTHTFTPGSLLGKSLTLQKGIEKPDGTVQAFTYEGSKIVAADFSVNQDGLLMMTVDFDAQAETTAQALASASYATPVIFTYSEGTLKKDNVAVASVRSVPSVRIENNLLTERMFLGNAGLKEEQINVPFDQITGSLDVEFQNLTDFYNAFAADTELELELLFEGATIEGAHKYTFQLTVFNARLEGDTPQISGPELVYHAVPFVGLDDTTPPAVEIIYKTTDTSP